MGCLCRKLRKKRQEVLGGGKEDGEHSEWSVFGGVQLAQRIFKYLKILLF
jgi:hypothetical protein